MKNPDRNPSGIQNSPVIRIGEDRELLRRKLEEYKERLKSPTVPLGVAYRAPEALFDFDTVYKIAVTEALVNTGEVSTYDLSHKLKTKYGFFDSEAFNNACGVVEDYIKTGGKGVRGGTGLPKGEEGPEE